MRELESNLQSLLCDLCVLITAHDDITSHFHIHTLRVQIQEHVLKHEVSVTLVRLCIEIIPTTQTIQTHMASLVTLSSRKIMTGKRHNS